MKTRICKHCNQEFSVKYNSIRKSFCSRKCKNLNQSGERHPNFKNLPQEKICKFCGKTFKIKNYYYKAIFCNRDCHNKWATNENANGWIDGRSNDYMRFKNSKEYKKWRKNIFERDNYTCQHCGYRSGNGMPKRDIHPHHIKSASVYIDLRIDIDNGITLCNICHGKVHSINFKNRKYKK